MKKAYLEGMQTLIEKGHVEKVPEEQKVRDRGEWYMPLTQSLMKIKRRFTSSLIAQLDTKEQL